MKQFKGAYPVLVTPMNEDGEVNWSGLRQNIEHFINEGVAGIIVNGSTGEFVSLTKEERCGVAQTAVDQVSGRIPLLVGTAAETTHETVEYTKQAEDAGADGALLINSYYAHPKDEEIYEHFKTVAESVTFPLMIYNNPFTSGVDIGKETILRTAKDVRNITHIKESSGDIRKVREIVKDGKGHVEVFCGADDIAFESLFVGATGWVSVAGNVAPKLVTDLFNAAREQDLDKAWQLYYKVLPLCNFIEGSGKYVQIVKRAMDLQGLAGGPSRKPRLPLTENEETKLKEMLDLLQAAKL